MKGESSYLHERESWRTQEKSRRVCVSAAGSDTHCFFLVAPHSAFFSGGRWPRTCTGVVPTPLSGIDMTLRRTKKVSENKEMSRLGEGLVEETRRAVGRCSPEDSPPSPFARSKSRPGLLTGVLWGRRIAGGRCPRPTQVGSWTSDSSMTPEDLSMHGTFQ